jgi:hypothetical protein
LTLDVVGVNLARGTATSATTRARSAGCRRPSGRCSSAAVRWRIFRIYKLRTADLEFIRLRSDGTSWPWRATLDVFGVERWPSGSRG